jgi:hypothetical protein
MADFVAVIRRAVDGLATNTPETRARVYEKARGAVQRQLENMKPRPPEEMLRRQLDKVQAAIDEVEAEHREAFAVDDAPLPEPEAAFAPPVAQPPVHEEPVYEAPAAPVDDDQNRYYRDEPEEAVPAAYEQPAPEPEPEPEPEPVAATLPVHEAQHEELHAAAHEPVAAEPAWSAQDNAWDAPSAHGEPVPPYHPADTTVDPFDEPVATPVDEDVPYASEPHAFDPHAAHPVTDLPEQGTEWHGEQAPQATEQAAESWTWHEPAPAQAAPTADIASAWDDVPELVPTGPVESIERGPHADNVDAHFDEQTHVTAETVRMPVVSDLPELASVAHTARDEEPASNHVAASMVAPIAVAAATPAPAFEDPFAEYPAEQGRDKNARDPKDADRDPWGDLEELIGYNGTADAHRGDAASQPNARRNASEDDDFADLMPPPAKPYRVTPVRKRNYSGMILAVVALLLVGGVGYALWTNRDALTGVVDGLMQSSVNSESSTGQATPAQTPAPNATPTTPAQPQTSTQTPPAANGSNTAASAVAPAAGDAATGKFTQRLMPDGKEVDEGPGSAGGLAQNAEGQSVAQLNAPPANPAPGAGDAAVSGAGSVPAAGAAPTTPSAPTPSANPTDTPAVSGEKMFLYEERIGQTAPTAVDGSVSWSLQREPGANGSPPEPVVQGRISIPGRGMTALMTFKRNTDPSLPASHLIEIVFSVPPDFEGGAIDSVQRIAMKQTEQDRGNALIAVPAKITDDFHMIALNDFPDARATNLDLMRTRNWIDIPLAYRNGRRALLTLQKGPEGEKAFNEAIREWGQMAPTPSGQ